MTSKEGSMLPRELIVWLQSLHLSHHIKHPKRDLSNGFIIAQICHYYWGSNVISLHSFTNGCGLANKQSNWSVLRKAFAKQNIPLSEEMINGMISCKDKYAECFLGQLYTILTGKELKQQQRQQESQELETQNKEVVLNSNLQDKSCKTSINANHTGATQIKGSNGNYGTENKIQVYNESDNVNDTNNHSNNNKETLNEIELRQEMTTLQTHSTAVEYISRVISLTLQKEIYQIDNLNACSKTDKNIDAYLFEEENAEFVKLLSESANVYNRGINDNNKNNDVSSIDQQCNKYKSMQFISHFIHCAERQEVHEYSGAAHHKTEDNENSPKFAVMNAVWSALHARLPLIVEHYIVQSEMNVIDLIETFLFVQKEACANTQINDHDLSVVAPLTLCDRSFTFIHALLSLWNDSNPHACFNFCVQHLLTLPSLLYIIKYNTNYNIAHKLSFILCAMLTSRSLTLANRQVQQMCTMIKHYIFNIYKYYYTKHEQKINDDNIVCTNVMIDLSKIHYSNNVNAGKNGYTQEDKTQAYLLIMQTLFVQVVKRYALDSNMQNKTKWCNNNDNGDSRHIYSGLMKTRSPLVNRASITSVESISDLKEEYNVLTNNKEKYKYNEANTSYHDQSRQMLHFFVESLFSLIDESVHSENAELELLATSVAVSLIKHASSVLSLSFINTLLLPLFFSDKCFSVIDLQNESEEVIITNSITWIDVMKVMLARCLWQRFARFDYFTKENSKQYNTNTYNNNNNKEEQHDKDKVELPYIRNVLLHVLHEYSCRLLWSFSTMNETQESTKMLNLHNAMAYELAICLNYLPQECTSTINSNSNDNYGNIEKKTFQNKENNTNNEEKEKSNIKNDLQCNAYSVALFIAQSLLHYYKANKTLDTLLTNVDNINTYTDNKSNNDYEEEKCTQQIENKSNRENERYINSEGECNLLPPAMHHCNVFSCSSSLLFTKALFGLYPNFYSTITELVRTADELILQNMIESVINNETRKTSSSKTDKTNNIKGAMTRDVHAVNNKIKQRLSNRVSALSRQKNVPVDVEVRICWLYVIIISSATSSSPSHKENKVQTDLSYEAFHTSLPTLRERKALRRKWNVLLQLSYDDIALITMAAELAARQLHNRVNAKNEESTNKLLQLAAQAQQVVCYWYTTLSLPNEISEINNNGTNNTQDEEKEVESTVVRAMKWYHEVFGRETN